MLYLASNISFWYVFLSSLIYMLVRYIWGPFQGGIFYFTCMEFVNGFILILILVWICIPLGIIVYIKIWFFLNSLVVFWTLHEFLLIFGVNLYPMLDSAQIILTLFVGLVGASRLVTTKGIDGWWLFLVVNILLAILYIFQNMLVLSSAKQI